MAIGGKRRRRKWRRRGMGETPSPRQEQAQTQGTAPGEQAESAPAERAKPANVIRKGIYLSALIYVEGDMPAPDDFISPSTNALKSVLDQALRGEHDGLSMQLKKIEVRNDIEQDDEEDEGSGEEEKFQF